LKLNRICKTESTYTCCRSRNTAQARIHIHNQTLIPVAGKPIISHIIDQLFERGIRDFVFVIGYLGEKIKNYIEVKYPNINSEFVHQHERKVLGMPSGQPVM
jgi:NDP-sugar pyrophosphorylase family protein